MKKYPFLKITAEPEFLPVVVSFVENTCLGFGFSRKETTALVLAAEEIFVYLNRFNPGAVLSVLCTSKQYLMEMSLRFNAENFNLRAFNLTSSVDVDDESSLDEMGLLIAGRLVDSFTMEEDAETVIISLQKYRGYKESVMPEYAPGPLGSSRIITSPDRMETLILMGLINKSGFDGVLPFCFQTPEMVADMKKIGDINVLIVKDHQNTIAGGLFWQKLNDMTIEIVGPYVYGQADSETIAAELVDKCLETIGKETCSGVFCRYYGDDFPEQYFETVGSLSGRQIYFRSMQEDPGSCAWIHPSVKDYISGEYEKLFLPRNVLSIMENEEYHQKYSVISSELNPSSGRVVMRPLILGEDYSKKVREHISLFESDNYEEILFELDLGDSQHASWMPALLENGFRPVLLLPNGGKGDLMVMKYGNGNRAGI